jgi:hypothetical protein
VSGGNRLGPSVKKLLPPVGRIDVFESGVLSGRYGDHWQIAQGGSQIQLRLTAGQHGHPAAQGSADMSTESDGAPGYNSLRCQILGEVTYEQIIDGLMVIHWPDST